MKVTPMERKIADLATPVAESLGLRLVCVRITGEGGAQNVQVIAENPATRRLPLDDCTRLSRELSALMDVEDPVKSAYRLEVSSPGIDRLLISPHDFADFSGFEAKIELEFPQDGQKRFRGILRGIEGEQISLDMPDKGLVTLPFGNVAKARLVLTDALIAASKPQPEVPDTTEPDTATQTSNNDA
ncbi:MAG: ribosome maturation factor RimP [Micavibrio aeruginosavorus]|uniref:Ribosome maturation factor RimP n=1 Tax=Micavibrio aeruginosavorus TaxID=349221 RepID=A0A7T5R115_9BACT|nr:MAG: ribosome maturation factor RimP [Micavibrio aeruginosavorus]